MKEFFTVLSLCLVLTLNAQVGINTTNPQAQLDVRSSNQATPSNTDGIIIPKVDNLPITNPTNSQDGMLVFVTGNGSDSRGFYFWDDNQDRWISINKNWEDLGNALKPSEGSQKNVIIGNGSIDLAKLTIVDSLNDVFPELYIEKHAELLTPSDNIENNTITTRSNRLGIKSIIRSSVDMSLSLTGIQRSAFEARIDTISGLLNGGNGVVGFFSNIYQSPSSEALGLRHYGVYNRFNNENQGSATGTYNEFLGGSTGAYSYSGTYNLFNLATDNFAVGTSNEFRSINGGAIGLSNGFNSDISSGNFTGVSNNFSGEGATRTWGFRNYFGSDNNSTDQYGVYNDWDAESGLMKYGIYNNFEANTGGTTYGAYNYFNSNVISYSPKYGTYNEFNNGNNTNSDHIGLYNQFDAATNRDQYGVYNKFNQNTFDDVYGSKNEFGTDVAGTQFGNYNEFNSTSSNTKTGDYTFFRTTTAGNLTGYYSEFSSGNSISNTGFLARFSPSANSAIYGLDIDINSRNNVNKYGVRVQYQTSQTQGTNYGIYSNLGSGAIGSTNYGIYTSAGTGSNSWAAYILGRSYISYRLGIGVTNPIFSLQLNSNSAAKTGSSAWFVTSDRRLKKDIKKFDDGLSIVTKIQPVWFTYNGKENLPQETAVGAIAQDLQKIVPYMVKETAINEGGEKYKVVDYGPLNFVLINAIKELKNQLDQKDDELNTLKAKLKQLENLEARIEALEAKKK